MVLNCYQIAYETVGDFPGIEVEYYSEKNTARERNVTRLYDADILTLESPITLNKCLRARMEEIKGLSDDWDGYGAVKPSPLTISRVEAFLNESPNSFIEFLDHDNIYPNPNGTITLEWEHEENGIAGMEIGDTSATFYAKFDNGEFYINNNVDINDNGLYPEVLGAISKIIS